MKSRRTARKLWHYWASFLLVLLVFLCSDAVSVVPSSPADRANRIIHPLFLCLTVLTLIMAVGMTIAEVRKRRSKRG